MHRILVNIIIACYTIIAVYPGCDLMSSEALAVEKGYSIPLIDISQETHRQVIVDKEKEFWPASMESFEIVKTNFWPILGFAIVTAIIGSLGVILCAIGVILTAPIQACMLTVAYRDRPVLWDGHAGDRGEG